MVGVELWLGWLWSQLEREREGEAGGRLTRRRRARARGGERRVGRPRSTSPLALLPLLHLDHHRRASSVKPHKRAMPAPAAALLLVAAWSSLVSASPTALAAPTVDQLQPNQSPAIYEPYLAFPHPHPNTGRAFLPADGTDSPPHPLLAHIRLPDNPTNPAPRPVPAYDRHPLYVPGREANFSTAEFKFDPRKLDKRAVVSSVDIPFPPSACASSLVSPAWARSPCAHTDARLARRDGHQRHEQGRPARSSRRRTHADLVRGRPVRVRRSSLLTLIVLIEAKTGTAGRAGASAPFSCSSPWGRRASRCSARAR